MAETKTPAANGIECKECMTGFTNYHLDTRTCALNPEHEVAPVFITREPLGWPNDYEFLHGPRGDVWVYPATMPKKGAK